MIRTVLFAGLGTYFAVLVAGVPGGLIFVGAYLLGMVDMALAAIETVRKGKP